MAGAMPRKMICRMVLPSWSRAGPALPFFRRAGGVEWVETPPGTGGAIDRSGGALVLRARPAQQQQRGQRGDD
ncbi:hypothetical protein, partial [Ralstonia pseudosolanacearum]